MLQVMPSGAPCHRLTYYWCTVPQAIPSVAPCHRLCQVVHRATGYAKWCTMLQTTSSGAPRYSLCSVVQLKCRKNWFCRKLKINHASFLVLIISDVVVFFNNRSAETSKIFRTGLDTHWMALLTLPLQFVVSASTLLSEKKFPGEGKTGD